MANPTMTLIASNTVGSGGTASVTFSSIPQTYTDLKLVYSTREANSGTISQVYARFNGDSSSIYTGKRLFGYSGSASSASDSTSYFALGWTAGNTTTANTFGNGEIYIPNYTSSNYKSVSGELVGEDNSANTVVDLFGAYLYSSTSAITSIFFGGLDGNFMQYSTFYLYGISSS